MYLENETYEAQIFICDHIIYLESEVENEVEDAVTSGTPENWYAGSCQAVRQVKLLIKCDTLDTEWLTENITDGIIWAAFGNGGYGELVDTDGAEFFGKDKEVA